MMRREPEAEGLDPERLARAFALLRGWVKDGTLPGVSALVARRGMVVGRFWSGLALEEPDPLPMPVAGDTIFAVASITKPLTATAVMLLAERGLLSLDQPVRELLPEFGKGDADPRLARITVRHFLTHTSGLPEYSEENESLRRQRQGLDAFVRAYCRGKPLFDPGSRHSYSNYGYGLLGEIVSRLDARGYHRFVADELLAPLGMVDSFLQPPQTVWPRLAHVSLPTEPRTAYERYNSSYFRRLGIPWGGLYTTPEDLAVFAQLYLDHGRHGDRQLLSPATVRAMTRDHLGGVPGGIASFGLSWPSATWGLGWDVKGGKAPHFSGELTSADTFGHVGSSGSLVWVDPTLELVCVFIANRSLESGWAASRQALFSNAVVAAVVA
ncbi:MAG: serine hydrolase domain-containing protein [Chloroflexota bacterium]